MISLYGLYPHIIEAYFDGNELIIHRANSYFINCMDSERLKSFAPWSLAQADVDTDTSNGFVNVAFGEGRGLSVA